MKYLFLLFISLFSIPLLFAQFTEPDEKKVKDLKILEYKITGLSHEKVKSKYDGKVLKQVIYNQDGRLLQKTEINIIPVYTVDSTFFTYDDKGNNIEILNIYSEGQGDVRTIQTTKKSYSNHQLTKSELFIDENLETTTKYTYDPKGRISREQQNSDLIFFVYNKAGQLIQMKQYYPNEKKKDTLISIYKYDEQGNKTEEILKELYRTSVSKYKYNEKNLLVEKNSKIESVLGNSSILILYAYDEKGNCIERKSSKGGVLESWKQFHYDEKNLPAEEIWMNLKTGKKRTSFLWEYQFRE